jgi:hypothetical protein
LQKLLNPFPQIYDKPFSADVGTLLHDGATIPRLTSGSRVVVASTVESAAFSVSFADFASRNLFQRRDFESRKKRETSVSDASRNDEIPTIFNVFSRVSPSRRSLFQAFRAKNVERRRQKKFH